MIEKTKKPVSAEVRIGRIVEAARTLFGMSMKTSAKDIAEMIRNENSLGDSTDTAKKLLSALCLISREVAALDEAAVEDAASIVEKRIGS